MQETKAYEFPFFAGYQHFFMLMERRTTGETILGSSNWKSLGNSFGRFAMK